MLFVPLAGDVMVTSGATPRLTVIVATLPAPNELVHWTLIVLAPSDRATLLVEVLVELVPFTVQVVPAGIVDPPLTV